MVPKLKKQTTPVRSIDTFFIGTKAKKTDTGQYRMHDDKFKSFSLLKVAVIEASQKTEIPGHYLIWFLRCLESLYIEIQSPKEIQDDDDDDDDEEEDEGRRRRRRKKRRWYDDDDDDNEDSSTNKIKISLYPQDVKLISWSSKNYHLWIKEYSRPKSILRKYSHFFNFTINSDGTGSSLSLSFSL